MRRFVLILVLLFAISCGSKKKVSQKTKTEIERLEKSHKKQTDSLLKEIEFRNRIIELSIEPVDPKVPNEAKFTKEGNSIKYTGINSKVNAKSEKKDSLVKEVKVKKIDSTGTKNESVTIKEKSQDKEVKHKNHWWIICLVILLTFIIYFKATGRRIFG